MSIGTKYSRLVGQIEKAFEESSEEILTTREIETWFKRNTSNGLSLQRISSLMTRRPQFILQARARRKNSNEMNNWYSLGHTGESVDIEMGWVEVPLLDKMTVYRSKLIKQCPHTICMNTVAHHDHISAGGYRCVNCEGKMDVLWQDFQFLLEKY